MCLLLYQNIQVLRDHQAVAIPRRVSPSALRDDIDDSDLDLGLLVRFALNSLTPALLERNTL